MTNTETSKPAKQLAQHDRRFSNDSDDCRKARRMIYGSFEMISNA